MKILVSGSSGLVGRALSPLLEQMGYEVWRLVRSESKIHSSERTISWNLDPPQLKREGIEGFDVVIHLSGESIAARRWTSKQKEQIVSSRVSSTNLLASTLSKCERKPSLFICASAVGYYPFGDIICTEDSKPGSGFLADTCIQWEAAAQPAHAVGIRTIHLRFGIVLSRLGGALQKMLLPFQLGVGGQLGDGEQKMSWVSLHDVTRAIAYCIHHANLQGPVNCVSPQPVTNKEFTKTLGAVLRRPTFFRIPAFMIRLLLGEMGQALLLSGCPVIPKKLQESGFEFEHPTLTEALQWAVHQK